MIVIIPSVITILLIAVTYVLLGYNKKQMLIENLTVWLIFSVIIALTPLIFNLMVTFVSGVSPTIPGLLGNGELLIVSVAIGADGVGKLIGTRGGRNKVFKVTAAGGCVVLITVSSLLFAAISGKAGISFNVDRIATSSILMFYMTLVASGSCILLSEVGQ